MAQARVDTKRGPFAFEPVSLDEASLAPEVKPFEEAVDGEVSVVGLGKDAMDAMVLEQPGHHGAKCLCRQSAALRRGREGDAHLCGLRLIGRDAHRAVAAQCSTHSVDGGQLQPSPWIAKGDAFL